MLSINLLPQDERESVRLEKWRRMVIFFSGGLVLILVFGLALFLPSFLPLLFEQKEINRLSSAEEDAMQKVKTQEALAQAQQLKGRVSIIKSFVTSPVKASLILEYFTANDFQGIKIQYVSLNKNGDLNLTGTADSRRHLLDFEDSLNQSGKFMNVYTPLSNIVRGLESFNLRAKVKPEFGL